MTRFLVPFLSILLSPGAIPSRQGIQSKLTQRVAAFDSESSSTAEQLISFARQFQIPMGIELVETEKQPKAPAIHARNTSASQILEQILEASPNGRFSVTDGLVHVFSGAIVSDERNFLNLRVGRFSTKNESLYGAEFLLRTKIRQTLNPTPGYAGGHGHGLPRNDGFDTHNLSLSIDNATVREVLNGIASSQGNAVWVVQLKPSQMIRNGNRQFYAQAASLESNQASPDFHWQFLPLKTQ